MAMDGHQVGRDVHLAGENLENTHCMDHPPRPSDVRHHGELEAALKVLHRLRTAHDTDLRGVFLDVDKCLQPRRCQRWPDQTRILACALLGGGGGGGETEGAPRDAARGTGLARQATLATVSRLSSSIEDGLRGLLQSFEPRSGSPQRKQTISLVQSTRKWPFSKQRKHLSLISGDTAGLPDACPGSLLCSPMA